MSTSITFLLTLIVIYTSITTVPVYTISPFTVGTSLIGPFVSRLKGSSGPLTYKFCHVDVNGLTMIAEEKRYYRCLWLCKHPHTIYEDLCVSFWDNKWACPRKNLTQFETWTKITFSAENNCTQITSHLYATYRHSKGIQYKHFAEDIDYLLQELNHLNGCRVQSTLYSFEFERQPDIQRCHGCRPVEDFPQAVTTVRLHFF